MEEGKCWFPTSALYSFVPEPVCRRFCKCLLIRQHGITVKHLLFICFILRLRNQNMSQSCCFPIWVQKVFWSEWASFLHRTWIISHFIHRELFSFASKYIWPQDWKWQIIISPQVFLVHRRNQTEHRATAVAQTWFSSTNCSGRLFAFSLTFTLLLKALNLYGPFIDSRQLIIWWP